METLLTSTEAEQFPFVRIKPEEEGNCALMMIL